MGNTSTLAILGAFLFGSVVQSVSAQADLPAAYQLAAYAGYLNNLTGQPDPSVAPSPFDASDPSGLSSPTVLISSGSSTTGHDTGVIRFANSGVFPITIDKGLTVSIGAMTFSIWDNFLPATIPSGGNLVLAETETFNFDTSDTGPNGTPAINAHIVIAGTVSGQGIDKTEFKFENSEGDCAHVPQQSALCVLLGNLGPPVPIDTAETLPYTMVGFLEPHVLPSSHLFAAIFESCNRLVLANYGDMSVDLGTLFSATETFAGQDAIHITTSPGIGSRIVIPASDSVEIDFEGIMAGPAGTLQVSFNTRPSNLPPDLTGYSMLCFPFP